MNLGAVTTLVFDLDGVVWRGDAPIASAISAIHDLRSAGKRCLFCTNNSSQTQAAFVAKLEQMGIDGVAEEEIITSSSATALYLSAQYTGPFLAYVVGGEGIRLALQKIGARIVFDIDITEDTNVDCVVAGIDFEFTFEKLRTAQRLINRGALFIATNRDATYPVENGVIPGAGAIISAIETASGSTPVTIGKPRPVMVQLVMERYGLKPEQIAVIGDRLDTDIVCARRAGVAALLVTTGVTSLQQARRAKGELRPDAVFPDLTTFAEMVLQNSPATPLPTDEWPTSLQDENAPSQPDVAREPTVPSFQIAGMDETVEDADPPSTPAVVQVQEVGAPESETPPTIEPTMEPAAEPVTEYAIESDGEISNVESEKPEGWDDTWFEENAESESVAPDDTPTEATQIEAIENDVAQADVVASPDLPPAPTASTPDGDGSKDDGFNWKLD